MAHPEFLLKTSDRSLYYILGLLLFFLYSMTRLFRIPYIFTSLVRIPYSLTL